MCRVCQAILLIWLLILVQACATARVGVVKEAPVTAPKFDRVVVAPFGNEVGSSLPATAPENVAEAVIAMLQKEHPTMFREVSSTPSNQPTELFVQGKILKYNPGSKTARFMLIGLGAGKLELDVVFVNAATGETVERFSTSGEIMAGGIMGASMGIEDMINSAAKKIVQHLVRYGGKELPKGKEVLEVDRQRPEEGRRKVMASIPSVPLPEYEISPPPPNAPPEIKTLLGKWQGHWEEAGVPVVLVVQKVFLEENRVECIYGWAAHSISGKDREADFKRVIGNLIPGSEPVIRFGRVGQKWNYNFVLKGKLLYGTREYPSKTYKIVMEKVE